MTAQCRWLNTVQSAQSGCPAGIWFPIKFPKTSPAWIALRSQSARSDAVRIFVSRQDAVSLRCHGSAGYGKPAAHRFSSPQVRLPQTAAVFSVTVIPLFRRPDGRGCLYRPAVFVSKPITPHKPLFPSIRPYRAGVQWRYGCTFFLQYRCFCCPDCCKFSNFRWQITADSSSVSRSGLAYAQTSPAEHSQTFPMAAHGLLRSFQIPPSSHKWVSFM